MKILGFGQTHTATACLLVDDEVVACASEERFTRVKSTTAFPRRAIDYVLSETGLDPDDLDGVAHSFRHPLTGFGISNRRLSGGLASAVSGTREYTNRFLAVVPSLEPMFRSPYERLYQLALPRYEEFARRLFASRIGVDESRMRAVDHHEAHAYAAYGGFYLTQATFDVPALVFTLDAEGDNKCATVSVGRAGELTLQAATPGGRSIGVLYGSVTELLGMSMNEHEYKVMGLAPYAPDGPAAEVEELLSTLIWVDGLTFKCRISSGAFKFILPRLLKGRRFDAIAGGVQRLLERRVAEWVRNAVQTFGIRSVVLSGGVFMNVKANKTLLELPEIESLTVCPSAADESTPIGAAWAVSRELRPDWRGGSRREREPGLYIGPSFAESAVEHALEESDAFRRYQVRRLERDREAAEIARLLQNGEIVARMAGRMEFGARALGNRSILADPSRTELVRTLNEQIKGRDFWMPFACTILAEESARYIVNPKSAPSPHMMIAFDTTEEGRRVLKAGIHPHDFTIRPQLLRAGDNERFHAIINSFFDLCGIAAVLNTSFNLHGEPIVCSPQDALATFARSGLRYLQLETWLISKRP